MQDRIRTGEIPRTETERDPAGSLLVHLGRRGVRPGCGVGQRLSPQLEKAVPSLEGCVIAQNLPASATPRHSGWAEGALCRRIRPLFPWNAVGRIKPACVHPLGAGRGEGSGSVCSRRSQTSLKCSGTDKASWDHILQH